MLSARDELKSIHLTSVAIIFCLPFLCSCATQNPNHLQLPAELPADVTMNPNAGRGDFLMVTLQLEDGESVPFVVDTGWPVTAFDKSFEPKLGKRLDTVPVWNFGVKQESGIYAAPKLYLGNTPLMTGAKVATFDSRQLSFKPGHPIMGILGMDVLKHYCLQLDFAAGKLRFLDDENADKKSWGDPFPLTVLDDGCLLISENLAGTKGLGSLIDTGCDYDGWLTPKLFQQWTNQTQSPVDGEVHSPNGVLGGQTYRELNLRGLDAKLRPSDDSHVKFNGIGLHVLSENLVTFDFPQRTMYLKRTSDFPLVDKESEALGLSIAKSALEFLDRLKQKGRTPGLSESDEVATTAFYFNHTTSPYLDSVTWDIRKEDDSTRYHYTITRASQDSPWKLQKAWRTDANNKTLEEYPIP